jgi:hypothetical protein
MALNFNNIFHCKTLKNLPKLGLLVLKYTIWQPRTLKEKKLERSDFAIQLKASLQQTKHSFATFALFRLFQ